MKNFTLLVLLMFCAITFAQKHTENQGHNTPIFHKEKNTNSNSLEAKRVNVNQSGPASFTCSSNTQSKTTNEPPGSATLALNKNSRNSVPVTITHSNSQTILALNSVTCNAGGIPTENMIYRDFDLANDFGIAGDFDVTHAEFGVEEVTGPVNLTINIYSTPGPFPTGFPGSLTLQGSAAYVSNVADALTIVSVPVTATIPAGEVMIYEVRINPGAVNTFFPGSNDAGQTGVSWIAAADCGITNPTDFTDIGFPDVHMVMNIVGEEAGGGGSCDLIASTPDDALGVDTWVRPFADGTCCSGLGPVSYHIYGPFTVDVAGSYTIDSEQFGWDGYLFLYQNSFDPLNQTVNFVAGNDDFGSVGFSQIISPLTDGTDYFIITTGFAAGDFGDFETTITGPGTVTCGGGGGGGNGNEWTVNVQGPGFGDEVSWELRDDLGAVILSGGPYGSGGYNETLMVNTENEPLEFYIESIGTFNDNTPTYTVSCGGEVVATGTLAGGQEVTESGLVCPGGNNWECEDAFELACGDVVAGSTTGATNSGGNASPDVYYTYTGSGDAEYITISLCDGGTSYDSYLRVFASCANLNEGSEIALNDDFCGLQSQLTFESDGTSTYIIMVEGFGSNSGDFSLAITCELIPVAECGGQFVDSGGPNGNYSNNEDTVTTILPDDPEDYVIATFTSFDVEANWDALYVFDGPDTSSPLISSGNPPTNTGFPAGGYWGNTIPGPFASTHPSGALTFRFLSDGSVTLPGWVADITCLPVPPSNDLIVNAIDVDEFPQPYTDPDVRLIYATNELLNPQGCAIAGTNGVWYKFTATADGSAEASITTPAGASAVIFYSALSENVADETELTYTFGQTNQCGPGTSSAVATVAGQSYYLFVLNTGGESDVVIDISNSLGTDENEIDGFAFYPNPMDNLLNLHANNIIDNVIIYNLLGQKVLYQNIDATSSILDVSRLSTGAYIMKVISDGQSASYQLIKK